MGQQYNSACQGTTVYQYTSIPQVSLQLVYLPPPRDDGSHAAPAGPVPQSAVALEDLPHHPAQVATTLCKETQAI